MSFDAPKTNPAKNATSTDVVVNHAKGVASTEVVVWKDPYVDPPPRGVTLDVLTWMGTKTSAIWGSDSHLHFAAWSGKLSVPDWLKDRIHAKYSGKFNPTPPL